LLEIEDLRRQLASQTDELKHAESEKDRMSSEKREIARTVAALENDLRRVRRDAEAFGRDLKALRQEKAELEAQRKEDAVKTERSRKQNAAQIKLLNEQLDAQRDQASWIRQQLDNHVCTEYESFHPLRASINSCFDAATIKLWSH
jgi:myosin protein heavy chain